MLHALVLALAGLGPGAIAQTLPGLPSFGQSAAPAAPAASQPTAADWNERLEAARTQHRRLLEQPLGSAPLLADRQMASARRLVLLSSRVQALRDGATAAAGSDAATPGAQRLSGAPPYSLLEVDALRDRLDLLNAQQSALRRGLKSLDATLESAVKARAEAEANLRLRREPAALVAQGGADDQQAQIELAELMSHIAELEVMQADDARQRARATLEALEPAVAELRAEIERTGAQSRLDDANLARVLKDIEAQRKRWAAESTRIAERLAQRESQSTPGDAWRARAAEPLGQALQMLGDLDNLLRNQEVIWRARQAAVQSKFTADRKRTALERAAGLQGELRDQGRRMAEEERVVRSALRTQQALVAGLAPTDPTRPAEEQVLRALQTQIEVQDRLGEGIDRTLVLVERARHEMGGGHRPATAGEWFASTWEAVRDAAVTIWQFELFSATETARIDGRIVTVDHGVTVGKSIGVLVMLGLGYWAAGWSSRLLIRVIGRRVPMSPQLARVLRRWISSILMVVVLWLVLKMARIPLTAFAFLGGALAIGIGFGAQNVIKNLISGVIILFERKIRVGDIVSIGGMTGTVTTVDLRATTVRGFDGIDAIVPNSTLLENQISNWSGGSPEVRRTIAVGIAYGSDLRQAAQIVLRCAQGNPHVLAQPAADVLFEDFGADSLLLRLRFWTRLDDPRGGSGVDSDLRFAIHDALAEAGIVIAFPQRDVHLDVTRALRVELAPAPAAGAPGGAGPSSTPASC